MKNYFSNLKRPSLFLAVLLSAILNLADAQSCNILGPTEGCAQAPASFQVSTNPGDVVSWSTTTGQTATGGQASFTFQNPGNVTITVKVTAANGTTCTQDLVFSVNALPVAAFDLLSAPFQCFTGNQFCFKDKSTPGSGRTMDHVQFLFGDGAYDYTTGPGGTYCHTYPNLAGGYYSPIIRVFNDKGCVTDYTATNNIYVTKDIGADFSTNGKLSCGKSTYAFQNNSTVLYNHVKYFHWDFGDGSSYTSGGDPAVDQCYWNPTHVYDKHGCFDVKLIIEDDSNCWDTAFYPGIACNVNPNLVIKETNGKDDQCQTGNSFVFTHNIDPLNWPVQFIWVFDDPNSGPQNIDKQNFKNAPHKFTAPDLYTVTIQGTIAGCPFFSSFDVMTKGPAATIDAKSIPDIIADSLRHQCQIKDTVYFKNNSAFAFNDTFLLDDKYPGAASVLKENNMVLLTKTRSVMAFEDVIDTYIWGADTMALVEKPLKNPAHTSLIKHELVMFDNFFGAWGGQRQDDHVTTLWDFGDNTAPQCTTWTKYMQNVWDTSGKWINCNFSRDPKPKHWYYPGHEGCFTVKLQLQDTTWQASGQGFHYWEVVAYYPSDTTWKLVTNVLDTNLYNDFLRDSLPDPSRVIYYQGGVYNDTARFGEYRTLTPVFDYPPLFINGDTAWNYTTWCPDLKTDYKRDKNPAKRFLAGYDTTYSKWYINPNHLNGNDCKSETTVLLALEGPNAAGMKVKPAKGVFCLGSNPTYGVNFDWSGTKPSCTRQYVWMNFDSLLDRRDLTPTVLDKWTPQIGFLLNPTTPWPLGTLNLPQFPNQIYYDYTGKLADSCGHITVGLRIQNGYDPYTHQPCIDEKWYHDMLHYTNSDPEFTLDTVYGCHPLEVELTFIREYHDSLDAMMINVGVDFTLDNDFNKGFTYIDSVYRHKWDARTQQYINYILTFYVDRTGIPKKIDSTVWTPNVGGQEGCGSELKIKTKRRLTFREDARYNVLASSITRDGCTNTSSVHHVVVGFAKVISQDKSLICRNDVVEFNHKSLYLLLDPDPVTGAQFVPWDYWMYDTIANHGNYEFEADGVTPRSLNPKKYEKINWDFGQGVGFTKAQWPSIVASFNVPGHYIIQAEFVDSTGCRDTMRTQVDVTGGNANFNYTVNIGNCKPIVNFFDSSICYDPCKLVYHHPCDSIIRWVWDFGDGSPIINTTSYTPGTQPIINPSHLYSRYGDYDVKLVVQTAMDCWDTLTRTVSIAGPRPKFDFTIDSIGCVPYTVYLGNFSIDASPNSEWTWYFGDNSSITTQSDTVIYHTYDSAGVYEISLLQKDIVPLTGEVCRDSFPSPRKISVTVLPEKKVDFIPSKVEVCPNEIITFTDTSDTTYTTFIWDFGDQTVLTLGRDTGRVVQHSYKSVGTYIVRLHPDYTPKPGEPKCRESKAIKVIVRDVNANFSVDTTAMPLFKFTNNSTNYKESWWRFGDGDNFTKCPSVDPVNCPNAQHNYGDHTDSFDVCLVVLSPEGCYDTACATIYNHFDVDIKIPNVFTPNGDDKNDSFKVQIKGWTKYEIKIYNRYSELVFQSTTPDVSWNGKKNNTGADLPAGVYYVVVNYQLRGLPEQTYNGTITLIR